MIISAPEEFTMNPAPDEADPTRPVDPSEHELPPMHTGESTSRSTERREDSSKDDCAPPPPDGQDQTHPDPPKLSTADATSNDALNGATAVPPPAPSEPSGDNEVKTAVDVVEVDAATEPPSVDDPKMRAVLDPHVSRRSSVGRKRIFFNPESLPASYPAYVAWLDVMGSKSAMSQSLMRSAQYIGRLHVAILMNRKKSGLFTSPFMDGAYVRSDYQRTMLDFLWGVFEELAYDFLTAREHRHRFMPRCGLSFGHIIQGTDISTHVSIILGAFTNVVYREGIYLGFPMVQAYASESQAAPFGIAIHESARSFSHDVERPLAGLWWRWHLYRKPDYMDDFVKMLFSYFDWCQNHTHTLGYAKDRILAHRQMASEYFDFD
jgi:hypothetical protein